MPTITDFFTKFGWPEFTITLLIILIIAGSHEWRKVVGIFKNEPKEKKE